MPMIIINYVKDAYLLTFSQFSFFSLFLNSDVYMLHK